MAEEFVGLEHGQIGFFWPVRRRIPDLNEDEPDRGHARIEGQWATIDVLIEDVEQSWLSGDNDRPPTAIMALTPETAAVLLEVDGPYRTHRWGTRASSARYRARTVVGGLDITALRVTKPLAVNAHFRGIGTWAGLSSATESRTTKPDGRLETWAINLKSGEEQVVKLPGARRLVLSTHWSVSGPVDQRSIATSVTVGCEASRPRDIWDLLGPLVQVQGLLSTVHAGFVPATGGTATMSMVESRHDPRAPAPWLWNGALMVPSAGSAAPEYPDSPVLTLQELGGVPALRRWVALATNHPRAVTPIVNQYRLGSTTPAVALLEVAAGIEYWVRSHGHARWATKSRFASALAAKSGRSFSKWVGDPEAWAAALWAANNHLKHEPIYVPDPYELSDLASSGRWLLTATVLDQVAGSKSPSRTIFQDHRLALLGSRLRNRFT